MTRIDRQQLWQVFMPVVAHYGLSHEARAIAWEQACRSPVKAYRCYLAIARSL